LNVRAAILTACVALSSVVGCAVQGEDAPTQQEQTSEGLTIVSADAEKGVVARWSVGTTKLEFRSKLIDGKAVGEVYDASGARLSTVTIPVGGSTAAMRPLLEQGAAESLAALTPISKDPQAIKTLVTAYRAASTAFAGKLPETLPKEMIWSLQMQTSVLSFALLHVNPKAMQQIAPPQQNLKKTGYVTETTKTLYDDSYTGGTETSGGALPNDDYDDYHAAPTTWQEYDEYGNPVGGTASEDPYRLWIFSSARCDGACGPGCDWCVSLPGGRHLCETNAFCFFHDRHCGAWEHFFDCSWKPQF
jgi:hypothetical protein